MACEHDKVLTIILLNTDVPVQESRGSPELAPWRNPISGRLKVLGGKKDVRSVDANAFLSGSPGCYSEKVCVCIFARVLVATGDPPCALATQ